MHLEPNSVTRQTPGGTKQTDSLPRGIPEAPWGGTTAEVSPATSFLS